MSAEVYPANVPPITFGADAAFIPHVYRSQGVAPVQELASDDFRWVVSVRWLFNPVEYEIFMAWYADTLGYGNVPFVMPFDWGDGLEDTVFEFEGTVETSLRGFEGFEVSTTLFSYHEPALAAPEDFLMQFTSPDASLGATIGQAFSANCEVTNAITPVYFAPVDYDEVPEWLDIAVGGLMTGTPPGAPMVLATPTPLPSAAYGFPYSTNFWTVYGSGAKTFSLLSGSLPDGYTLNSSGVLAGTAVSPLSVFGRSDMGLVLSGQTLSRVVVTLGGTKPLTFSLQSGSLPAGVTLDTATGVISGSPEVDLGVPMKIITEKLPAALLVNAYSAKVFTFSGVKPITFSILSGSLPAGLSLNTSTGEITGTPS